MLESDVWYLHDKVSEYEYILRISGGGLMNMLIADDHDNILTGIHPQTDCSYYINTENVYEEVEPEDNLTLDTAYEFYKNRIQNRKAE